MIFNGKGLHYCKNCGGADGIHHYEGYCPANGEDQTGRDHPYWLKTTFEPQEYEADIKKESRKQITVLDHYFAAAITGIISEGKCYKSEDIIREAILIAEKAVEARNISLDKTEGL